MDREYAGSWFNQSKDMLQFEASFGVSISDDSKIPMKKFLESSHVVIHPLEWCKMPEFFRKFDRWCILCGYGKQPHQKYSRLWKQYSIKTGKGKMMFGVSIAES